MLLAAAPKDMRFNQNLVDLKVWMVDNKWKKNFVDQLGSLSAKVKKSSFNKPFEFFKETRSAETTNC